MSGLPFPNFLRCAGKRYSSLLNLLLVLLGAILAYWLAPGLTEGPGF